MREQRSTSPRKRTSIPKQPIDLSRIIFYEGQLAAWDLVKKVKDDKKVVEIIERLGAHFCFSGILSACARGIFSLVKRHTL